MYTEYIKYVCGKVHTITLPQPFNCFPIYKCGPFQGHIILKRFLWLAHSPGPCPPVILTIFYRASYIYTLKTDAVSSSETLIRIYQDTSNLTGSILLLFVFFEFLMNILLSLHITTYTAK
jgi:hypothetical protein